MSGRTMAPTAAPIPMAHPSARAWRAGHKPATSCQRHRLRCCEGGSHNRSITVAARIEAAAGPGNARPLHPELVAPRAHAFDDAGADLAGFLGGERALGRSHREPERDALLSLFERRAGILAHELDRFQQGPG